MDYSVNYTNEHRVTLRVNVYRALRRKGWDEDTLSIRSGVDVLVVKRMLAGEKVPAKTQLRAIATALDTTTAKLIPE